MRNPFPGAFGLDIGDLSIKLVQLDYHALGCRQPYFSVRTARGLSLPPGYIVNGEIQQPEMVRKKILLLLGKDGGGRKKIRSEWVVADLPEPKTFFKLIEIDIPTDELTDDDVSYNAKKHLPFELDEAYLSWQIIPDGNRKTKILLAGAPKAVTDSYTYLLESVGLNPVALEVEAMSLSRALITAGKNYENEARALLDIGATRSSLIVYDHNTIQFSTNLEFSGEILTTAIAQELKMEYARAEDAKIKYGLSYCEQYPKYLKIVTDQTEKFIGQIKTALTFYKEHFSDANPVTHITMCGGASSLLHLDATISRKLKITARPGHAWKNLLNARHGQDDTLGLAYASAIGLSLRAASSNNL